MRILDRWVKHYKCYTLEKDFEIKLEIYNKYHQEEFISLLPEGELYISKGYSWNGCSPKFEVLDMVIGTPEGVKYRGKSKTYYPSLVHDVLYQIRPCKRKDADKVFLKMMRLNGFRMAWFYYLAVRFFGKKSWRF